MPLLRQTASRRPRDPGGGRTAAPPGPAWRRPYPPGPFRVGMSAALLVLVTFLLAGAALDGLAGADGDVVRMLAAAVLVTGVALRMLRVGLWIGPGGLRAVTLLRTSTVPWDRVASVRTVQQPVRWLSLPRRVQGQAVVVRRTDGRALPELVTDSGPDFLGRRDRFGRAAEAFGAGARG